MGVFIGTTAGEIQLLEELDDYKFKKKNGLVIVVCWYILPVRLVLMFR